MNHVEEQLLKEKKRIDSITAPEEMEARLRNALNGAARSRTRWMSPVWRIAAVALFLLVIFGYHYNAFAYYGKKLLGFDELISGTRLQELNEQGMGQPVGKQATLTDGTELTIDGIMADANQLVMYYTLRNPKGIKEDGSRLFWPSKFSGFLTSSNLESSVSLPNEEHTEIKGTMFFEPVSPFAKKLTLHYYETDANNQLIEHSISFPYDPNQAILTQIKYPIHRKIKVDQGVLNFQSITATPSMTMIKGTLNVDNFDRLPLGLSGIELIANGESVEMIGSGHSSAPGGRKFDLRYDALPKPLESLELVIQEFIGYRQLDQRLPLASAGEEPFFLADKELWVKKVAVTSQGVEITIATGDDILLDGVSVEALGEATSLRTTVGQIETELDDGTVLKERTLLFDTRVKPEYLYIKGMHYIKAYNEAIEIPVD